jgi:glycosyltransferase involved in cell wall biosynthesis
MNNQIVIFGASSGGEKVAKTIINIGLDFAFFLDNDYRKHNTYLNGKLIKSPNILLEMTTKYKIIIASIYHDEIKDQLINMGIKQECIILKEQFILEFLNKHSNRFLEDLNSYQTKLKKRNILIELGDGMEIGGIEKWGITVAEAFCEQDYDVTILTKNALIDTNMDIKCNIEYFDLSPEYYHQSINLVLKYILTKLPCVIIINKINQIFFAAYLLKKYYKDSIKIISVLHSDFTRTYEQNKIINNYVDNYLCVSNDVKSNFEKNFVNDANKIHYKESPIVFDEQYFKTYSNIDEPIRIGYGARLEKAQKRADLLIPLINQLEKLHVMYTLDIAGDGSYFKHIQNFIIQNSLENKIRLHGSISFKKMNDFWKSCDICINLSDIEGIGLSMLEAMALGVIPIVTETAGAKEFIKNGVNGFINSCNDVYSIAKCIEGLSNNRDKLSSFGDISRTIIKEKCSIKDYLYYIEKVMQQ